MKQGKTLMKTWMSILLMTACACIAIAQDMPPVAAFYCLEATLTDNGQANGKPLPDGTPVQVFWDWDNNGPDEKDPLPVVGEDIMNSNFNTFYLNGEATGLGAGKFETDPAFVIAGALPKPATYYLRACLPNGKSLVSEVVELKSGYQQFAFSKWTVDKNPCKDMEKKN